ncbi:MAG: heme exporter protein CcmD [Devosia marina]|jgi:heme exporter protein CcmD|uniref:Heme exporter protein D n=1 Tax=Devosia marina TaxID=2683198 RepID=A0A7X3K375_9HYPH|nr:heme exporter protein CcmD [Devosia marina]MVS99217.1 heme exporter protein CcmD [Devosia marina]
MIALGEHAEFIFAAYAGVFVGLGLLIGWIVYDSRRVRARLETLGDKRG